MKAGSWRRAVQAGIALALGIGGGPVSGQDAASPLIERALESRTLGSDQARVVVFEVADFQCAHCARFAMTVGEELERRYVRTGRVQWVFVTLPLQPSHLAWLAAEAALCAGATGHGFWAMRARLYAEQGRWSRMDDPRALFARYAREAGAPAEAYDACVAEDRMAPLILQDFGAAVSAGITGTPTFIVMRGDEVVERILGVAPLEDWVRILDAALDGR